MKPQILYLFALAILSLGGCIGDDIIDDRVDPIVRISNPIDTMEISTTYQFEGTYLNNVGKEETNDFVWSSSSEDIISITTSGLATAHAIGNTIIKVESVDNEGNMIENERMVVVGTSTVVATSERTGTLQTTSSYALQGDFTLKNDNGNLVLSFGDNYNASTSLPGLYAYLTNNPNTTSGAYEIGKVSVFDGAHSYELPNSIDIMDYEYVLYFCKPFNVKVGDGQFDN